MKILVTAFDPFGGELTNPSQEALAQLPEQIGTAEIMKVTLPTAFSRAASLAIEAMDQLQPNVVVCLGQAGGRKAVTPERVAINLADARIPDNEGRQPEEEPVVPGGPAAYFSTLPVKAMAQAIRDAGLPGEVSNSAGTFVCNHLLYSVLHHAAARMPETRCCFIHMPYLPEQAAKKQDTTPSMPLADIVRALEVGLGYLCQKGDRAYA